MSLPNLYGQPLRKVILTAAIGQDARDLSDVTWPVMQTYASDHGYDFVASLGRWDGRPPAWTKVHMLREYLYQYDLLMWLDCDVLIRRGDYDVGELLTKTFCFQALAIEDRQPNTGVWIVRGSDPLAASFLAAVDAQADLYDSSTRPLGYGTVEDQAAVKRLLGYHDRPASDLCLDWLRGTLLLPPELNDLTRSRPSAVMHHHANFGRPHAERLMQLREDAS